MIGPAALHTKWEMLVLLYSAGDLLSQISEVIMYVLTMLLFIK